MIKTPNISSTKKPNYIIIGSNIGSIYIIDFINLTETKTLEGHTDSVTSLLLYKDEFLISGSVDSSVRKWDLKTRIEIKNIKKSINVDLNNAVWSLLNFDNDKIYTGLANGNIICIDFKTFKVEPKRNLIGHNSLIESLILIEYR